MRDLDHHDGLDDDCASFLTDIADEVPVEQFESYAADVGPYLPPDVLQQLRRVEHLLAEARKGLLGAGQSLSSGRARVLQPVADTGVASTAN
jgi:hypothetical protein